MNELKFYEKCIDELIRIGFADYEAKRLLLNYRYYFRHVYTVMKKSNDFKNYKKYVNQVIEGIVLMEAKEKGVYSSKSYKKRASR